MSNSSSSPYDLSDGEDEEAADLSNVEEEEAAGMVKPYRFEPEAEESTANRTAPVSADIEGRLGNHDW